MARYNPDKVRNLKEFLMCRTIVLTMALLVFLGGIAFFERYPKLLDAFMAAGVIGAVSWITYNVIF